jgi:hypothetical protein
MRSLSVRLLLSLLTLILVPAALAHDVTLTGTTSFTALDGSSSDHDGSANGVFTVNDGNLVVNGVVNCNDDGASNSACPMSFNVSGNMTVNTGGALYAENRTGSGTGGAITLTVGGNLALNGNAIVSTASKSSSGSTGGAITANVGGNVALASGTTIDSGSANAAGGAIVVAAGGTVSVNGNVFSGPSRTLLATRLSGGAALDGGTSNTIGGAITIGSSTFAEPSVVIGSTANIVSQGADGGAGPVTIDGCGVQVYGLIAALSKKDGAANVRIRSGKDVLVDGRDLGGSGTRMGRIRADAPTGTALNKGVDVFATETIDIFGPASGLFVITALPGLHDSKSYGGLIRVISLGDAVNMSGNVIDDGHTASGDSGGTVEIAAKEDVNLNTAVIRAHGDFNTNNNNRGGGSITVRSHSGDVIWTNGTGDVRPVGSASGLPPADQGKIFLTACGTVNTTGTSFPTNGVPTGVFPVVTTGVCSPAAPSLPSGVPALVTCNTPPVANDVSATTNEDNAVTITLSGTDADGDPLTFSVVSGPSNGVLGPIVPTGPTTATVNYTPNLNYNGADSFVYEANDGNGGTDTATVSITIVPVNDPPSFLAGPTVTVLEDSGPQAYANWATSISPGPTADEAGQTVTFTVTNDNNALFSVQPALSSNGTLTFTPAANANGSATITITAQDNGGVLNGGDDTSNPQASSIIVTAVNDEPSFTPGGNVSVGEDSGAYSAAWATGISAGPADESGQTLTFNVTGNSNPSLFASGPSISASGVLTFTPAADANGTANVTVNLQDSGGIANGGDDTSPSQTFTISVSAVNDPPSFTSGGDVTVLEDSVAYSAAWATGISAGPADESGQTLTFNITGNSDPTLFASGPSISPSGVLSFTLNANAFGSSMITVTLSDNGGGTDTSAPQSFTIIVDPVNDEPSFTSGGDVAVNEDSGAYSAAWATAISAGPANESGQTLTFFASNDNNALFSVQPTVSSTGVLSFTPAGDANGSAIVTVYLMDDGGFANGGDDTSASQTFTITVNAVNDPPSFVSGGDVSVLEDSGAYSAAWATSISAGPADESSQALTFNITGNSNPSLFASGPSISATGVLSFTLNANAFGSSTITVTLSDNGGGADTSAPQSFTITVGPVNDEPSFVAGGNVTVNEDSGAYSAAWATAISAGPNESGQTLTFNVSNDNNALFSAQPSISSTGVLSFTPAPNASGFATVTVYLMDNGGIANGGDDTSPSVTFTITVIDVNEPPVAGNDSWETEGNTELRVDLGAGLTPHVADTTPSTKGVLDNDADGDADPLTVTGVVGCGDVVAPYDCAVTGGTVSLNANGSFSFQPSPGATSASFQYTITDGTDSATGTVNFTIHDMIWYVNGSAASGGNGTSSSPFDNFGSLNGGGDVDGVGDYIFVHTSTVNGSMTLEASQKLWGEGVGLIIPRNLNGNGFPTTLVAPGTRPTIFASGDAVLVAGVTGVEIAGLTITTASGDGIDVTSLALGPAASATIYSNGILASGSEGIDINAGSAAGTSVSINTTDVTAMGDGVDLLATDGNVVFSFSNGTVSSATGTGIVVNGAAADSLTINGLANVTISGTTAGDGVSINVARFDANTGTAAFDVVNAGTMAIGTSIDPVGGAALTLTSVSGDLAFGTLGAHGSTTGATIAGTGLFTGTTGMRVTSGGGAISAAAGVGLSVTNSTIGAANLSFTSISSTGGANGILLNNTGTSGGLKVLGTGAANSGGTIQNKTADGVSLRSTQGVSLSWMNVQNTAHNGIFGSGVVGFTFTNGSVSNTGTAGAGAAKEGGIAFNESISFTENNLSGAVSITGSSISNARRNAIEITNWSGTLSSVTISNNVLTSTTSTLTSLGHAIQIVTQGSATTTANVIKADILNNQISNFPSGSGIFVAGGNPASVTPFTLGVPNTANAVTISGNQIAGASPVVRMGSNAIQVSTNGCNGQANFVITNNGTVANPLTNFGGLGISHFIAGTVNATALIDGNVIVANNTIGAAGIATQVDQTCGVTDAAFSVVTITNNLVSATEGFGIRAIARASNGTMNLKVADNTVGVPTLANRNGIRVDSGSGAGDVSLCLEITNNVSAGSGISKGIALRKQGTNSTINSFGVVGMVATSSPGVETYVDSQNPAGGGTELISATSGFTNCSL